MNVGPEPRWLPFAVRLIRSLPVGRYRAMNWVASNPGAPFWTRLPPDLGALAFRCDLRDALMREACLTGRYEPQETTLLQQLLRPGMTFVDVGANWGYFTLVGAHLVGARGRVISVEPDPRACRTIRANIAQNGLTSVSVVEAAASDRQGTISLQTYGEGDDDLGNFGVAASTTVREGGTRFEVSARPLDDVLDEAGVDRVDLLKMDIEGAEARALPGLARRLASGKISRLLLELHPAHLNDQGSSANAVVAGLRSHGYRPWRIDHRPATHRRAAAGTMDARALLSPLDDAADLGDWPHLLWTKDEQPWIT